VCCYVRDLEVPDCGTIICFLDDDIPECEYWGMFNSTTRKDQAYCLLNRTILVIGYPASVKKIGSEISESVFVCSHSTKRGCIIHGGVRTH
jgi:hypothetical protein